jgi:ABC-type phosphonate transport system ATPase subunit
MWLYNCPPAPPETPGGDESLPVTTGQEPDDREFLVMYGDSASDIESRLESVNANFFPATQNAGITYSPSKLRVAALEMKNTAEQYHQVLLKIENFEDKENEFLRNEYLGYLSSITSAGGNIAEAAQAEGAHDYGLSMNYAERAKTSLERIEGVPDANHEALIMVMRGNLEDMETRMKEAMSS